MTREPIVAPFSTIIEKKVKTPQKKPKRPHSAFPDKIQKSTSGILEERKRLRDLVPSVKNV